MMMMIQGLAGCQLSIGEIFNPENLWKLMQVSLKAQVAFSGYLDTFRGPYDNKDFRFSDNLLCVTNFIAPSKAQAKSDQSKHLTEFIFKKKFKESCETGQ